MINSSSIPFYLQMIALVQQSFALLDLQGREEVLQFTLTQQNPDGGFRDRGGRSDLYYSLFGMMILRGAGRKKMGDGKTETGDGKPEKGNRKMESDGKAGRVKLEEALVKLKQFTEGQKTSQVPGFIERCCLVLLQKELKVRRASRLQLLLSLGRSFIKERHSINLSYRSFVLFLTLEAVFPFPSIFKSMSKRMLERTEVDEHSPCAEIAARVFLLKMLNYDASEEQELLATFALESGGFKAFTHLKNADMLSTAVALFALTYAGHDVRLLLPSCLDFIEQNYAQGAFFSGDGDTTADVEYTFYGLLALGVLAD